MGEKYSERHALLRLSKERYKITQQQYRTLRGQIFAGDIAGAMRGLDRLLVGQEVIK